MRRPRTELGHLESAVLGVVAAAEAPLTVSQVQAELPGGSAYTTVMSTLARLARKGVLKRSLAGRAYRYEPAVPEDAVGDVVTARQMRRLMTEAGHRHAVLARFVAELSPDEERLLTELLARAQEDADGKDSR